MTALAPVQPAVADDIRAALALYAHAIDNGDWAELNRVFTTDVAFHTTTAWARGADGIAQHVDAVRQAGFLNPHHGTEDLLLGALPDGRVRAWHSFLVVRGNGEVASGEYLDTFVRTDGGWRIAVRRADRANRPQTDPGGPSDRSFTFTDWETDEQPEA